LLAPHSGLTPILSKIINVNPLFSDDTNDTWGIIVPELSNSGSPLREVVEGGGTPKGNYVTKEPMISAFFSSNLEEIS